MAAKRKSLPARAAAVEGRFHRVGYGEALLEELSRRLTAEFGRGFDPSNLRWMRLFFQRFSNRDAVRHESSAAENRNTVRSKSWYVIKRDAPGLELGPSDAARMYLKCVDAPVGVKPAGWS